MLLARSEPERRLPKERPGARDFGGLAGLRHRQQVADAGERNADFDARAAEIRTECVVGIEEINLGLTD